MDGYTAVCTTKNCLQVKGQKKLLNQIASMFILVMYLLFILCWLLIIKHCIAVTVQIMLLDRCLQKLLELFVSINSSKVKVQKILTKLWRKRKRLYKIYYQQNWKGITYLQINGILYEYTKYLMVKKTFLVNVNVFNYYNLGSWSKCRSKTSNKKKSDKIYYFMLYRNMLY